MLMLRTCCKLLNAVCTLRSRCWLRCSSWAYNNNQKRKKQTATAKRQLHEKDQKTQKKTHLEQMLTHTCSKYTMTHLCPNVPLRSVALSHKRFTGLHQQTRKNKTRRNHQRHPTMMKYTVVHRRRHRSCERTRERLHQQRSVQPTEKPHLLELLPMALSLSTSRGHVLVHTKQNELPGRKRLEFNGSKFVVPIRQSAYTRSLS